MTATAGLHYETYAEGEWMLRIGVADAPPILFIPPLFEEMNRTRAMIVGAMRALATRGFACFLPDLPGTGESVRGLEQCAWTDWRDAISGLGETLGRPAIASFRGGCLLDDATEGTCTWRLAPVAGASLARDLDRAGLVGANNAGYPLGAAFRDSLAAAILAEPEPARIVRLANDPAAADRKLDGPALWRRSEPDGTPTLSAAIADDIETWVRRCAG